MGYSDNFLFKANNNLQKLRIKNTLYIAALLLMCYFVFHCIYGDRGVISYFKYQSSLDRKYLALEALQAERLAIENNTKLLRDDSLDQDLLDEKLRSILGFSKPTEKIIKIEDE